MNQVPDMLPIDIVEPAYRYLRFARQDPSPDVPDLLGRQDMKSVPFASGTFAG